MAVVTKSGGRSIEIQIDGEIRTLCTIGHVACALRRTAWTVKHWEAIGLLPPAKYVLNPELHRTRRRLYPAEYVDALCAIADRGFIGKRLDRRDWEQFRLEAFSAYERTMTASPCVSVTETIHSSVNHEGRQGDTG